MKSIFSWRGTIFLVFIIVSGSLASLLLSGCSQQTQTITPTPTRAISSTPRDSGTVTTSAKPCTLKQRDFEMGIAFPQWNPTAYSKSDNEWMTELPQLRQQTSACWVSMPVLFQQASESATVLTPSPTSAPTVSAFTEGVQYAHSLGLHVFFTPLIQVEGPQAWAGAIKFSSYAQEQQWFQGYWQGIEPYVTAAAQTGVEQIAIGTEEEWLQENAPDANWNSLITNIHGVFSGTLTYNMNFTALQKPVRNWMHNSNLKMIGISTYLPVANTPARIDPSQMPNLWANTVKSQLDAFAVRLGEPIFLSEVGYRNSTDALYHPWQQDSSNPADPQAQAGACNAALVNSIPDPHILGSFFWGWDETGLFNLKNSSAATAIQSQYATLQG